MNMQEVRSGNRLMALTAISEVGSPFFHTN